MSTLSTLTEELAKSRATLKGSFQGIPVTLLEKPNVIGSWSVKNVLAHIAAWELLIVETLPERLRTGKAPDAFMQATADQDAWNAEQVEDRELYTFVEQVEELGQTRQQLMDLLQDLGEEQIAAPVPWAFEGTLAEYLIQALNDHDDEHREKITRALQK